MSREKDNREESKPTPLFSNSKHWEEIRKKLLLQKHISVKPYTLKELAEIYKVCIPTFKRMIAPYEKQIGEHEGRYYSIYQVKLIFQYVDLPSNYTLKELAHTYQVSIPTFKGWLDRFQNELGEKTGHFYSLRQLYIIITKLDIPSVEGKEQDDFTSLLQLCNGNLLFFLLYLFGDYVSFVDCYMC